MIDDRTAVLAKLAPMRFGERVEALADRVLAVHATTVTRSPTRYRGNGFGDASVLVRRASLEDVFLILTGRSLED